MLARKWLVAAQPAWTGKALGSFESWSRAVRGILIAAGIEGFLANRDEFYRQADRETEE